MDSEGPIPASTPEEDAASAVRQWLVENPSPDAGRVRISMITRPSWSIGKVIRRLTCSKSWRLSRCR